MECNKDDAARAKEMAEKKLAEKDIAGAKRFALKALNLFPELGGLSQLLEIINVYVAYEKKVCGEVDWYGILGIDPSADDETIKRQYRRLALSLHPDKNRAVGADGAFTILSEAWSLLSNKAKRVVHDQRRNIRFSHQKATGGMPSMRTGMNGFHSFTANSSSVGNPTTSTNPPPRPTPPPKPESFWTSCSKCMMYFEYLKIYLNQNLLCPKCRRPFLAVEVPAPQVKIKNSFNRWPFHQQQQGVNPRATTDVPQASGRKFPSTPNVGTPGFSRVGSTSAVKIHPCSFSKPGIAKSSPGLSTSATQAASHFQQERANMKKGLEKSAKDAVSEAALGNKSNRPAKKRRVHEDKLSGDRNQMAPESGCCGQRNLCKDQRGSLGTEKIAVPLNNKPKNVEESSESKLCSRLMEKAKTEIRKKLHEQSMTAATKEEKEKRTAPDTAEGFSESGTIKAENINSVVDSAQSSHQPQKSSVSAAHWNLDARDTEVVTMAVPDPDFHDFDKDRTEKSFAENQVWAAYDDDDGMPRFYAFIHDVISRKPFKVRFSWLNSKTNTELGPLDWIGSGFAKTCGEFRIGKHEISKTLNSFSHMVKWKKGARGVIHIYPGKGDIWALYRNWSSDWSELTPDEVIHKYDMVEVLEDYNEQQGVLVAALVKVAGFKSVFRRHIYLSKTWMITSEEMFRFSHQVHSYLLTGQEAQNAPIGCRELDPAAMPLELLRVIKEAKVEEAEENAENSKNPERSEGAKGEPHGVADASITEDKWTSGEVEPRLREPIVTYVRKKKGKKVAGDLDEAKEETRLTLDHDKSHLSRDSM